MSKVQIGSVSLDILDIYRCLFESHLLYATVLWGSAKPKLLNGFVTLQKRAIRYVVNSKYNSQTGPVFRKLCILNVKDKIKQQQCLLAFRVLVGDVPNNKFGEIFVRVRDDKSPNPARRLQGDPNGNNLILPPIHFNKNRVELSRFLAQQIIASFNSLPPILKAEYDRV
jgi:hypothetical protein